MGQSQSIKASLQEKRSVTAALAEAAVYETVAEKTSEKVAHMEP